MLKEEVKKNIITCFMAVTVITNTKGRRLVVGLTGVRSRIENYEGEKTNFNS